MNTINVNIHSNRELPNQSFNHSQTAEWMFNRNQSKNRHTRSSTSNRHIPSKYHNRSFYHPADTVCKEFHPILCKESRWRFLYRNLIPKLYPIIDNCLRSRCNISQSVVYQSIFRVHQHFPIDFLRAPERNHFIFQLISPLCLLFQWLALNVLMDTRCFHVVVGK